MDENPVSHAGFVVPLSAGGEGMQWRERRSSSGGPWDVTSGHGFCARGKAARVRISIQRCTRTCQHVSMFSRMALVIPLPKTLGLLTWVWLSTNKKQLAVFAIF